MYRSPAEEIVLKAAFALAFSCAAIALCPQASAQKDRTGLIAAWEQAQRADPNTSKLEKVSDGEYNFTTKRFPFDGTLVVRNVSIDDSPAAFNDNQISTGTVEIELLNLPANFHEIYGTSFAQWYATNTLYWSGKSGRWLTSREYFQSIRDNLPLSRALWPFWSVSGWMLVLLAILAFVVFNAWRASSRVAVMSQRNQRVLELSERNSQIAERNMQLAEENNKIFREILDEIKKVSAARQ
jgi:hypothetical protein